MQTLRNTQLLTRLVLVWFVLFIGASVASPLVKPVETQMVCSVMGMKMVDDAGDQSQPGSSMDCPLCMPLAAPAGAAPQAQAPAGLSHALQASQQARLAARLGQPWQARAPPTFS